MLAPTLGDGAVEDWPRHHNQVRGERHHFGSSLGRIFSSGRESGAVGALTRLAPGSLEGSGATGGGGSACCTVGGATLDGATSAVRARPTLPRTSQVTIATRAIPAPAITTPPLAR